MLTTKQRLEYLIFCKKEGFALEVLFILLVLLAAFATGNSWQLWATGVAFLVTGFSKSYRISKQEQKLGVN